MIAAPLQTLEAPWMRLAFQELERGVAEHPGPGDDPRIVHYHAHTRLRATDDEVPWCSSFACCCVECGTDGAVPSPQSARARDWLGWGDSCDATYGAIVVLARGVSRAQGHVGFFLDWTRRRDGLYVLSGNQGDRVSIASFPAERVLDYRWPEVS